MTRVLSKALGLAAAAAALLAAATLPASADNAYEVEAARANARAGGPVSFRDAELLERYGALSGTPGYSPGGVYRLDGYGHKRYGHKKRGKSYSRSAERRRWHY